MCLSCGPFSDSSEDKMLPQRGLRALHENVKRSTDNYFANLQGAEGVEDRDKIWAELGKQLNLCSSEVEGQQRFDTAQLRIDVPRVTEDADLISSPLPDRSPSNERAASQPVTPFADFRSRTSGSLTASYGLKGTLAMSLPNAGTNASFGRDVRLATSIGNATSLITSLSTGGALDTSLGGAIPLSPSVPNVGTSNVCSVGTTGSLATSLGTGSSRYSGDAFGALLTPQSSNDEVERLEPEFLLASDNAFQGLRSSLTSQAPAAGGNRTETAIPNPVAESSKVGMGNIRLLLGVTEPGTNVETQIPLDMSNTVHLCLVKSLLNQAEQLSPRNKDAEEQVAAELLRV